jgi:hypothetical protein
MRRRKRKRKRRRCKKGLYLRLSDDQPSMGRHTPAELGRGWKAVANDGPPLDVGCAFGCTHLRCEDERRLAVAVALVGVRSVLEKLHDGRDVAIHDLNVEQRWRRSQR